MKVGTDGVLLGAWAGIEKARLILDIGTGTGLIALMLAQRSKAEIHAVEIDEQAAMQAKDNFQNSKWSKRLSIFHQAFQEFKSRQFQYELILTNPPFFSNSLNALRHERSIARHDLTLNLNDLFAGVSAVLVPEGRLAIIYPYSDFPILEKTAGSNGLFLIRETLVVPAPGKPVKRVLAEFSKTKRKLTQDSLLLEEFGRHKYSEEYKSLTREFYLGA